MKALTFFNPRLLCFIAGICYYCVVCTTSGIAADASEQAGFVIALRGKVQAVDSAGNARTLKVKSPFYVKDTIKTGKGSRLQLMFRDNTIISLGSSSEMKISEYQWDKKKQDGKITNEVKEGAFRIMGGLISKQAPDKFKTKTPAAVIGIRGSMYAGTVRDGKLSVVFEGGRGISLQNASGHILITKPGYGSHVNGWRTAIKPPIKFATRDFMKTPTHMNRSVMLKKVLKTMKNPTRAEFNAVLKDATNNELSLQKAEKVVEELKKDPDFGCK